VSEWSNGPLDVDHLNMRKGRIQDTKDSSPILLSTIWAKLGKAQRDKLTALGFDGPAWDNNLREKVVCGEYEIHVTGEHWFPPRIGIVKHDRAREPLSDNRMVQSFQQ
jgi:hypothetical protein